MKDHDRDQVERAKAYILACGVRKTVYRGHTSYTWKHLAERYFGRGAGNIYVSNTAMIEAAEELGVPVERVRPGHPNAYLGISVRGSKVLEKEAERRGDQGLYARMELEARRSAPQPHPRASDRNQGKHHDH